MIPSLARAPGVALLSPSLLVSRGPGGPAYELKFLLGEEQARAVQRWAGAVLAPDPHTDPATGAYQTTTLYCDTPAFDVFAGAGPGRRRKHRLRRYGAADRAFLERKTKWGARVRKRRAAVPLAELAGLALPQSDPGWAGHWFHGQLWRRGLRPVCLVSYDRTAFAGATAEGPLRVTLDRRLRGRRADGWRPEPVEGGPDLLGGAVIVEFKFQAALPLFAKRLVEELQLAPGGVSKYRQFLLSSGLVAREGSPDD
jgi:VTC domain